MDVWAKRQVSGFTIVELLIVIVVIGILAAITVVAYNGVQSRARQVKAQADITNVQKLVEAYYAQNGSYPMTTTTLGGSLNPDWGTQTARTDANCSFGTKSTAWVPDVISTLPQSSASTGVNGTAGCYLYASNGVQYVLSAWNMLPSPQTSTMYRRLGFREPSSWPNNQFPICNHTNIGGMTTGTYVLSSDYYKRSLTVSNITDCNETPPSGA